ncbi:MAG: AraC family transcriptional regulator [Elusimicrobiota bacterium]
MNATPEHKLKSVSSKDISFQAEGLIVDEFKDLKSSLGIVYYKVGPDFASSEALPRPALIFARCHSIIDVAIPGSNPPVQLDALATMLIPAGTGIRLKSVTEISHLAVLCPSRALIKKTAKIYKIPAKSLLAVFGKTKIIKRTNWLNEIVHRFIFERIEAGNSANEATAFLETEILKEIYYIAETFKPSKNVFNLEAGSLYDNVPILKRALNYIETHLFSEVTMTELAKHALTSEATLLRVFSKEFSKSPFNYIADRRLDESLALIRNKKYSVGEISDIVGYKTVSGFISAFRKRFKSTPLAWRNSRKK